MPVDDINNPLGKLQDSNVYTTFVPDATNAVAVETSSVAVNKNPAGVIQDGIEVMSFRFTLYRGIYLN